MTRLLVVADDTELLKRCTDTLAPLTPKWTVITAQGAATGLQHLGSENYDMVWTAADMAQGAGEGLLSTTREQHPDVLRIVLAGQINDKPPAAFFETAHQWLPKTFTVRAAVEAVARAKGLKAFIDDPALRRVINSAGQLPVATNTWARLMAHLQKPNSALSELADVLHEAPAVAAKVLQFVNSAYFGLPSKVSSLNLAVSLLGVEQLKSLVLSIELSQGIGEAPRPMRAFINTLQRRAVGLARVARQLTRGTVSADDAFTAALLADVGSMLLASRLPTQYLEVLRMSDDGRQSLSSAEFEAFAGVTHAQVGAYLLGLWGLPLSIVEAVSQHHVTPADRQVNVPAAVAIADSIVSEVSAPEAQRGRHRAETDNMTGKTVFLPQVEPARDVARQWYEAQAAA
ncbi:MAG: HDOD domain-containing protein [Myxococcaceae bacterium]|nr:HDOD domain-containing protein [Myxococcaceae bacterium]